MYMNEKQKKTLNILLITILSLVAVCGLALAFLLNYNPYVPDKVEIMQNDDQTIFFVKANTSYLGYRFVFQDENDEIIINCNNNTLTLSEGIENGINLGKTYKIKFCYLSKIEGNNSQYSDEIEWKAVTQLKAPSISYLQDENSLVWENVTNADYYMVYYNNENGIVSNKVEKTDSNKFELKDIPLGKRQFHVVACSNKAYIKTSKASNIFEKTFIREMAGFSEVNFDSQSMVLTLKSIEDLSKIYVYINDKCYECDFDKVKIGDIYVYTKDISIIYEKDAQVGAKPENINEFTIYNGEICYQQ